MKQIWSCGGGTQSAAIAALICEGKIEKPDYAVMVDTEREKSSTWRYVYGTIKPKLAVVGVDLVVVPKYKYATVDLYAHNGDLLIPAFVKDGTGKLPTFCSNEWKSRVIDRWLRERGVAKTSAVMWLGFSADELRRVRAGRYRYPLLFDCKPAMRRSDCREYLGSIGWPLPPRGGSACWMCPQMGDLQWAEMRESDPKDFRKACALEDELRLKDPSITLHRSGQRLVEIGPSLGGDDRQQGLFGCDGAHCFV